MNNEKLDYKSPIFDGLIRKNTLLVSGLVVAPVVVMARTVSLAIALITAFSAITFLSVLISSFISRKTVYTLRIILYTIIAALVYVPVIAMQQQIFPEQTVELGIYLPLLIANSLIVSKTEFSFYRKSKKSMLIELICYIVGFDIATLAFAFIREILSTGAINGNALGVPMSFPVLALPFGGFILLGLFAAFFNKIKEFFSGGDE